MVSPKQKLNEDLKSREFRRKAFALRQVKRVKDAKPLNLIPYDYETTRIQPGTPRPLYITAYSEDIPFHFESVIQDFNHLQKILINNFLTEDKLGSAFVAWNGNNFDAYFTAAALVTCPDFHITPYLTRSNSLRGMRVILKEDLGRRQAPSWQFLDGIAMLGLVGVSLDKFTANFAPAHRKMTGVIDWDREEFDHNNSLHRAYAMQDSVGLYHAMKKAQDILIEHFDQPLAATMGGACIKIFKANIPKGVTIQPPSDQLLDITRNYAMRGGFCYCMKRYQGPVWKYDLNQAYAAAMREAKLPSGNFFHSKGKLHSAARVFFVRITATNPQNKIPFYCRETDEHGRTRSAFCLTDIRDSWITSIEYDQLKAEGWKISISESYVWESFFSMKDYVDKLEHGRMNAEGGPSGPIGTMYKNVGNHSYGKTVEKLDPVEYVLANECPPGYVPYYPDDSEEPLQFVFYRFTSEDEIKAKDYHQPQIGAFITAHVRMVVRRAALLAPDHWLYADTDCVIFSTDVTGRLDIHAKRYGAWKIEEQGEIYQIIAKKVYTKVGAEFGHAKGLNVKKLTPKHYEDWYNGTPPEQEQVQRNNFLSVLRGSEMYRKQSRKGTRV